MVFYRDRSALELFHQEWNAYIGEYLCIPKTPLFLKHMSFISSSAPVNSSVVILFSCLFKTKAWPSWQGKLWKSSFSWKNVTRIIQIRQWNCMKEILHGTRSIEGFCMPYHSSPDDTRSVADSSFKDEVDISWHTCSNALFHFTQTRSSHQKVTHKGDISDQIMGGAGREFKRKTALCNSRRHAAIWVSWCEAEKTRHVYRTMNRKRQLSRVRIANEEYGVETQLGCKDRATHVRFLTRARRAALCILFCLIIAQQKRDTIALR